MQSQLANTHIYLLSNGFQPEYEIAFANGLYDLGAVVTLISSDTTLVARARTGLQLCNLRGSQREDRSRLAKVQNLLKYWWQVLTLMRREPQAIFHFNGLFSTRGPWANLLEALVIRLFCRHWWLTVHNLVPHDADSELRRRVNRWIYRLPNVLLVHTQKMKLDLHTDWGINGSKVLHIEHGIEMALEADATTAAFAASKYGIQVNKPIVLCFGNIAPYKGADLMIQALATANCKTDVRLVILGRARDADFLNQLLSLVKEHDLQTSVQVLDRYVDDRDMPGVLHLAQLIALPYRHIDQSGVLFTAKAARRPVLATPVGSIADYLEPGFDSMAAAVSPAALSASLDHWFDGVRVAQQNATIETASLVRHLWKNTLKQYQQLANTAPAGPVQASNSTL